MLLWSINNVFKLDISQQRWLKVLCNEKKSSELIVCNLVNANVPGTDFIVQSSDGVVFYLHRKNLEPCIDGAFPGLHSSGNESIAAEQIIRLDEPSSTLEIFFQFIYPRRHPSIKGLGFQTILAVANAVEKYKVFVAMNLCEEALMWVSNLYFMLALLGFMKFTEYPCMYARHHL